MKVFIISQGQDTGGQAYRTAAAFRKLTDWDVQAMCAGETYIKFPVDVPWDIDKARELYKNADVIEHQNFLYGYAMYDQIAPNKPAVVRHHGTPLRGDARALNKEVESIGGVQILATVDLLDDATPKAIWTPGFFDLADLQKRYPLRQKKGVIRIGHGPTVRESKGTDKILTTLNQLSKKYRHKIQVELTEHVTWDEALKRKAHCDIWVDQITLGYGGSTIEAMAMGIPVVSGWNEPRDEQLFMWATSGNVPFHHATEVDLEERIEELIESESLREEVVERQLQFVWAWHSEEAGVKEMKAIYENAPATKGFDALWLHGSIDKNQVMERWMLRDKVRQRMVERKRKGLVPRNRVR